jgi:hypothetical protein
MEDIRRQDMKLFIQELLSPMRIAATLVAMGILTMSIYPTWARFQTIIQIFFAVIIVTSVSVATAWYASEKKRWLNSRMEALWKGCEDRLKRFEEAIKRMRKDQVADLNEMPNTIRTVSASIYCALRRADMISHEVQQSEKNLFSQPPVYAGASNDPQSRELYRLADKNIAEYRNQFAGVMAGVQRTEAQSAVFMTTLDSLRMKMIGHRLVGRGPELSSHDFLEALAEARTQLQSIDTALEELDLGHYPKTISAVPPPLPDDAVQQRLGQ